MQSWRACAHGQGVGETSQATATGCRGRWRTVARRRGTATGEITLRALVWHAKKLNRMLGKNKRGCDHRGMVRPKRRRPWPAGRPAATACRDNNTGARARGKKGVATFLPCREATAEKMDGGGGAMAEFVGDSELGRRSGRQGLSSKKRRKRRPGAREAH
jgi:hypothetical protein